MSRKPFMPNPGRIGMGIPLPNPVLKITITVDRRNGNTSMQSNETISAIHLIDLFATVIKAQSGAIIEQEQRIVNPNRQKVDVVDDKPQEPIAEETP